MISELSLERTLEIKKAVVSEVVSITLEFLGSYGKQKKSDLLTKEEIARKSVSCYKKP